MIKNNKILSLVVIAITAFIIFAIISTDSTTTPKVAEFQFVDIKTPNFGTGDLKVGQIATITVNVKNISNGTIGDVYVKTTPKFSDDGEVIKILEVEKKIPNNIGSGGTSGPLSIEVKGIKVPTKDATETILVELFVNNQLQETRELEIDLVR